MQAIAMATAAESLILPAHVLGSAIGSALLGASTDPTRSHIWAVRVESDETGGLCFVGTDGHRMHVTRVDAGAPPGFVATLPRGVAERIAAELKEPLRAWHKHRKSGKKEQPYPGFSVSFGVDTCKVHGITFTWGPIGQTFPPWRDILPKASGKGLPAIGVNPLYLVDAMRAAELLDPSCGGAVEIRCTGGPKAPVLVSPRNREVIDFVALVMPVRATVKGAEAK